MAGGAARVPCVRWGPQGASVEVAGAPLGAPCSQLGAAGAAAVQAQVLRSSRHLLADLHKLQQNTSTDTFRLVAALCIDM